MSKVCRVIGEQISCTKFERGGFIPTCLCIDHVVQDGSSLLFLTNHDVLSEVENLRCQGRETTEHSTREPVCQHL